MKCSNLVFNLFGRDGMMDKKKVKKTAAAAPAMRKEHDSMGEILVPADHYWGAQTQRSFQNFRIGTEKMPHEVIEAFAYLKKSAAQANNKLKKLDSERCKIIGKVCGEILAGKLDGNFPLAVWQTGSGTQSNMNVNEVIAHRGNEIAGKELLHPNDHVNMSQSSNDTFPTAMHIAAIRALEEQLMPSLRELIEAFRKLEKANKGIVTTGRTHLQDAVPIAFSQEISGWRTMLERSREEIKAAEKGLLELALGGTAVGTGLNAPKGFDRLVASYVAKNTGYKFKTAANKFHALTSLDDMVFAHGALKALAANLMKIANDVRWLASGPRDGLGEITIPANEPGSSIMPGKVNPTQCEAVTMTAVQVMGNDATIGFAASQGNFQLNVFLPVTIYNFLQSVRLLSDVMHSFTIHCVTGIKANKEKMNSNLHRSLMLVTALSPSIGYENAAKVAKLAFQENISLKEATLKLKFMTEEEFDAVFHPEEMV
jgi:fumarate hydratase class II